MASETLYTDYYRMNENGGIVFREEVEVAANQHFATRRFMDIVGPFYPEDPSLFLSLEFPEYTEDPVLLPDENGDDPKINDLKLARELCIDLVESGHLNTLEKSLASQVVSFLAGFLEGYYRRDRRIDLGEGKTVSLSTAVGMAISERNSDYLTVREFEHFSKESNTVLAITNYEKTNPHRYSNYPDKIIELFDINNKQVIVLSAYGDGRVMIFNEDGEGCGDESEIIPQELLHRLQSSILAALEANDLLPKKLAVPVSAGSKEVFTVSPFTDLIDAAEAAYIPYVLAETGSEEKRIHQELASKHLDELSYKFESNYHAIHGLVSQSDSDKQESLIYLSYYELNHDRLARNVMLLQVITPQETGIKTKTLYFLYDHLTLMQFENEDKIIESGVYIDGYELTNSGYNPFVCPLRHAAVVNYSTLDN